MITSQERIKALFDHREPDRVGKMDHYWWQALESFKAGLPEGADPADYFDYDIRNIGFDQSLRLPSEVIEETDEYVVCRTNWGSTEKTWKKSQSTPELIAFSGDNREKWEAEYRARKAPDPSRIDFEAAKEAYKKFRENGRFVCFSCLEPFEATWRICGPEVHLEALVLDPDWVLDMYAADASLCVWAFEEMWAAGIEFDGMWLWGDISYRKGPMISPRMYREMLMPFHKKLCDLAHSKGCKVIYHGCGNNNEVVPLFIEAGIDCLQPLEVKAGMDVRELKRDFGDRMSFMGNIDARLMQSNDLKGLELEIRDKLSVAKVGGGYVYHSDHSVPPGTTLETYRFIMDLVERYGKY